LEGRCTARATLADVRVLSWKGGCFGTQLRGRILAMELLLSVLTNPGPVFRNNEVFISLVKKDLCLPLSKSGISPNRKSERRRCDERVWRGRNADDAAATSPRL